MHISANESINEKEKYNYIFRKWFKKISEIMERYEKIDDNPLYYNETASVSVFASAAMMVGMLSLAEFYCKKKDSKKLKNAKKDGRADLWVYDEKLAEHWFFEFKSIWIDKNFRKIKFNNCIDAAQKDAKEIGNEMAHGRFAVALFTDVTSYDNKTEKPHERNERLKNNQKKIEEFKEKYKKSIIYEKIFEFQNIQTFCIVTKV